MTSCAPIDFMTLNCPYVFQGFGVGIAISKFKQIGVWDKFPCALKDKAKEANTNPHNE